MRVPAQFRSVIADPWMWFGAAMCVLLLTKFLLPLFVFDVPLGYDTGIYRYLFVRHAEGFPPFSIAEMDPWAREHPLGLFFFSTILIRLGMPVSAMIGWMWNLMPVLLSVTLAWAVGKKWRRGCGIWTLVAAVLSIALYDSFLAMYWKTLASLFFCVLTLHALDRKSWWAAPAAMFALAVHHQTGLLLGLIVGTWAIVQTVATVRARNFRPASLLFPAAVGMLILVTGILWYVPVWSDAVGRILPLLVLPPGAAQPGSFPPLAFFLQVSGILLAFALAGFALSLARDGWTVWHTAVAWPLAIVLLRLLFHQRFYLHLEFFLLPFAAIGMREAWRIAKTWRPIVLAVLLVQACVSVWLALPSVDSCAVPWMCSVYASPMIEPLASSQEVHDLTMMAGDIPENAWVLSLDPRSAVFVRGWLTSARVAGPGIFAEPFGGYAEWERFILGTSADRQALLQPVPRPLFLYVSPLFTQLYGGASGIPIDPCVRRTPWSSLLVWNC